MKPKESCLPLEYVVDVDEDDERNGLTVHVWKIVKPHLRGVLVVIFGSISPWDLR